MHFLYNSFPRDVGLPYRTTVHSMFDLLDIINKYNTYKSLYFAIYKKIGEQYNKVFVDKIFFDFDGINAIHDIRILHKFCIEKDLKHIMFFSGGGFHCYIKIQKTLMTPQDLKNIHLWFMHNLRVNIDEHIIGDIARISRIPNTFNIKRKRYCIPITEQDLQKGTEYIREKAKQQYFKYQIYGTKILNAKYFKKQTKFLNNRDIDIIQENVDVKIKKDIVFKCLRPCIQDLCVPNAKWRMRFHIINEVINSGFSLSQCLDFLKSFLCREKYYHCIIEEKQPIYLYKRLDYERTSCDVLKQENHCHDQCRLLNEKN